MYLRNEGVLCETFLKLSFIGYDTKCNTKIKKSSFTGLFKAKAADGNRIFRSTQKANKIKEDKYTVYRVSTISFPRMAAISGCVGVNFTPRFNIAITFFAFCSIVLAVCSLVSIR